MNLFLVVILAFSLLMIAKGVLSGLYLQFYPAVIAGADLALAQEEETKPEVPLDEKSIMLRKKEEELREKEAELKKREEELLPLQKEINSKIEELNELQTRLTLYAKDLADREEALKDTKVTHLVALFSSMEPARAAVIMDKLNMDTIVRILSNMKGKVAGQILAAMAPEKGATISERLGKLE